jgi:glyoxylase-like metal-dependent hydrolase (beta-lactamase superfamily II)
MDQVAPGVYQLGVSRASNCFLITEPVPTLVDSSVPRQLERIAQQLGELGMGLNEVRRLILTHSHVDHIGNAQELRRVSGVRVYLHPLDVPYLLGEKDYRPAPARAVNAVMRRRMPYGPPWPVLPLEDGQVIDGIEVVHTPGHTAGHVCLLRDGVLLAGDAFATGDKFHESPAFFTQDKGRSRESIRKLLAFSFHTAVSGHGKPATNAKVKLEQLAAGF